MLFQRPVKNVPAFGPHEMPTDVEYVATEAVASWMPPRGSGQVQGQPDPPLAVAKAA